ncbi:MAG: O-antigen translocase [Aromatoleum sp.]|jgi:PST family polysaccharide transporter|uniref:O-antigen translocase n=1 Tax=Aromatoleum sp. TaxID=2307007 RepID=UPI0028947EDB|nr:O-antigen translocase [Aromatoleum sp.]MDT3669337.1 O-antigen translocase [Aromatoleum sp.]
MSADGIGSIRDEAPEAASRAGGRSSPGTGASSVSSSYGQILRSSALVGASSLVNIGVGILRTKAMALMLGPSGFGLMGLFTAISDLATSIATMGTNSSGVRQIAERAAAGDADKVARTATALRRLSVMLGLLGAAMLLVLAEPLSVLTFGSPAQTDAVALLSLVVFCACVGGGRSALIQGVRRIPDLVKSSVAGALLGSVVAVGTVYALGERGVAPALVGMSAVGALAAWWYSRKAPVGRASMSAPQFGAEASALLKLGSAFMASALMMTGAAYVVRLIVVQHSGTEAAGLYQAAWTLGGLYVAFILQAMGTDFYPRLTGVAHEDAACNRMVNEQAQVSMLLAGPGVLATLALSPLVVTVFYSAQFEGAVDILRWICLGMTLRVVIWPIGFILLAKGAQGLFFLTEWAWTVVYLGLAWIFVQEYGAVGAGAAFFAAYFVHGLLVYFICRRLTGFRWQPAAGQGVLVLLCMTALVFSSLHLLPPIEGMAAGACAVVASAAYSLHQLLALAPVDRIPPRILRLLTRIRPAAFKP